MTDLHDAHVNALKSDIYSSISDMSKEANGRRYRFDYRVYTVADLLEQEQNWIKRASEALLEEQSHYAANLDDWNETVQRLMDTLRISRHTAMKWLFEAENVNTAFYTDVEHYFWQHGVSFEAARELYREFILG